MKARRRTRNAAGGAGGRPVRARECLGLLAPARPRLHSSSSAVVKWRRVVYVGLGLQLVGCLMLVLMLAAGARGSSSEMLVLIGVVLIDVATAGLSQREAVRLTKVLAVRRLEFIRSYSDLEAGP